MTAVPTVARTAVGATCRTDLVPGLSCTVIGSGAPVTVFAHGLGGDSAETGVLALRAPGTRVLLDFRGHGASDALPGGWDYDLLADDLLAVADAVGATRAVGLSLGSGALLRALQRDPRRFERVAFVLPAALDASRHDGAVDRLRDLGSAIDRRDVEAITDLLVAELPPGLRERRAVRLLLRRKAVRLAQRPAPVPLGIDWPLADRSLLGSFTAPALVVAQEDDPLHDLALARDLTDGLPVSELVVLPPGGVFWTASRTAQEEVARHLAT